MGINLEMINRIVKTHNQKTNNPSVKQVKKKSKLLLQKID